MRYKFYLILAIFILFINFSSSAYTVSTGFTDVRTGAFLSSENNELEINSGMCESGQDFLVQIAPAGCSPSVVRSDLLEEQNVPVFCKIQALKINPAVRIVAIDSINFGSDYPKDVSTIAFLPSYPALGLDRQLTNSNGWSDIGYAVIYLKKNTDESSIPDMISGNLKARIRYSAIDAFGSVDRTMYLPLISDSEFDAKEGQYAFFNNMGYLRADEIGDDYATVSIYSGVYDRSFGNVEGYEKERILTRSIEVGETSSSFFLPGFGCFASSYFRLDDIEGADTRALLRVNSEVFELKKGETFLDEKCSISDDPEKEGLRQTVKISCKGDEKRESFTLRIEPTINISINGATKEYKVGDWMYLNGAGDKNVYLGYVGTSGVTENLENAIIYLVTVPGPVPENKKLDDGTLKSVARVAENDLRSDRSISDIAKSLFGVLASGFDWLFDGNNFEMVEYKSPRDVFGSKIEIITFGVGSNLNFNDETLFGYYGSAINDYKKIKDNFESEKYPEGSKYLLGEEALKQAINLSYELGQREDLKKYCDLFASSFPDSKLDVFPCKGIPAYFNDGVSSKTMLIGGDYKQISFEGVQIPLFEDYGVEISIRKSGTVITNQPYKLRKGEILYLDSLSNPSNGNYTEWIKLVEINDDKSAIIEFSLQNRSFLSSVGAFLGSLNKRIELNSPYNVDGTNYAFTINKINLKKIAKVSVHTEIKDSSEIEFNFNVGVEKRGIQLSPDQIKSQIEATNKLTQNLESISGTLGTVVDNMKNVCMGTGAVLTLKNLVFNSGIDAVARTKVMNGERGWYQFCEEKVRLGEYSSNEECLFENSDAIETQVDEMSEIMSLQNENFENLEGLEGVTNEGGFLGQDVVNQEKLIENYVPQVSNSLPSEVINPDTGERINLTKAKASLTLDRFKDGVYSLQDVKEIELYSKLVSENPNDQVYQKRLYTTLYSLQVNSDNRVKLNEAAGVDNLNPNEVTVLTVGKDVKVSPYSGKLVRDFSGKGFTSAYGQNTPVQKIVTTEGKVYYAILEEKVLGNLNIIRDSEGIVIYSESGSSRVAQNELPKELSQLYFKRYDSGSYRTKISNPEVKYYETDPYKGLPAVVPFDVDNGWYAYIPQTVSVTQTRAYDQSARVNSFWICNVGSNGIMEYNPVGEDEICQFVNLGIGQPYNQFPGLGNSESSDLVREAVDAIEITSRAYRDQIRNVNLNGKVVNVGSPAVDLPTTQCTDVMSPTDCQILFNACDPVICPSSRCDFGGEFPVRDVIQSGIIGSVALCLPNWNEGIYVPVCLTGVKAGLDGFISVTKSYSECLEASLERGETIGICDQIYSIYGCELVWRTALPIAQLTIPKIDSLIFGGGGRGGGEYIGGIQGALESAQSSVDFFTQTYAVSAYDAFKARSQEEVGTEVCKNFVSVAFPEYAGTLNVLSQVDSPPQFTASFEEIPFSSVTNPPQSHYKVFYHIFAGNNFGANYQVYLKTDGSSFYVDISPLRVVDSGYIAVGDYETQTIDFTAPEGYKELCVRVNNQEECGFGSVTTDFALDYLREKYVQAEANTTNIETQEECISGGTNFYNLLGLNLQEGLSDLIDPSLYNEGIIRICSTENPGSGSDGSLGTSSQRWIEVGYCGNQNVKCWIDKESVGRSMNPEWITTKNTLGSLEATLIENLKNQSGMLSNEEFDAVVYNLTNEKSPIKKISLIESIYNRVFENNKKGYLLLLEGNAYGELAKGLYKELGLGPDPNNPNPTDPTITDEDQFSTYTSNAYNYIEAPSSGAQYNYCYKFIKGTWQRAQKVGASCGEFSVVSGSVVSGKGFIDGIESLVDRVKSYPEGTSLSAGRFTLIGEDDEGSFYFRANEVFSVGTSTVRLKLSFNSPSNSWMINHGDGSGYIQINERNLKILHLEGFNYRELFLNLTDKNLYQGSIVLFEGKTFNFNEKTSSTQSGGTEGMTPEEIERFNDELDSITPFKIKTKTDSRYEHSFVYYSGKGWFVKYVRSVKSSTQVGVIETQIPSEWTGVNNYGGGISGYEDTEFLISSLKGKNFNSGMSEIVRQSVETLSTGNSQTNARLVYNKTTLNTDGTVRITDLPSIDDLYFVYNYNNNNRWMYGYNKNTFYEVTDIRAIDNPWWQFWNMDDKNMTVSQKNLVLSLNGKPKLDGVNALFLFNQTVPKDTTPGTTPTGCSAYYSDIKRIANEKGVDPYLVLAVMYKESLYDGIRCNPLADSGISYGLMQINAQIWCGKHGLPSNIAQCKEILLNNPVKNIEVGVQILVDEHKKGTVTFNGCNVKNKRYDGWEAALRRYNGLGCNENYPQQDQYVENVVKLLNDFKSQKVLDGASNPPESCPIITPPESISSLSVASEKVLQAAKELNGQAASREEFSNCWDAASYVYEYAGVSWKCVYSDNSGKTYNVGDGITTTSDGSGTFVVNPTQCPVVGKGETDKLAGLRPGHLLSIYFGKSSRTGKDAPHSVVFIKWEDPIKGIASLFDWNGPGGTYRYFNQSLKDSEHPVYMYWEPTSK